MLSYVVNNPEEIAVRRWGEAYRTYRRIWKHAGRGEYLGEVPPFIILDTIDACNLNCSICHQRGRRRTGTPLDARRVAALIRDAAPRGLYSINLSAMAEPYMHPENLYLLAETCRDAGLMDIMMHTNLLLPDADMIQRTVDAGVTHFCVSTDATTEETYQRMRGGDFSAVMENMRVLREIKKQRGDGYPIIRVSGVPVQENHEDMKHFGEFWRDYADIVEIQGYRADDSHSSAGTVITKRKVGCFQPWTRLMLWPTGEVNFCSSKEGYACPEVILGNYLEDPDATLRDYWLGEKAWNIRQAFRDGDLSGIESCRECLAKSFVPTEDDFA
ncbi:MAG: radical SAM protein [Desulfovibrio sp.]|nr:radical SAM protein [Desulfovibrio sp.]